MQSKSWMNLPGILTVLEIKSHKDLLWYGKVENYGYYSHKDTAVIYL